MQIPESPLLSALGLVQQPQAKANAAGPPRGRAPAPATGPAPARPQSSAGAAPGLARAQNLEQAVQALADQGRLPPRGSLIDLSA